MSKKKKNDYAVIKERRKERKKTCKMEAWSVANAHTFVRARPIIHTPRRLTTQVNLNLWDISSQIGSDLRENVVV